MHFVKKKLLKNVNFGVWVQTLLEDPLLVILSICWHCLRFTAAEGWVWVSRGRKMEQNEGILNPCFIEMLSNLLKWTEQEMVLITLSCCPKQGQLAESVHFLLPSPKIFGLLTAMCALLTCRASGCLGRSAAGRASLCEQPSKLHRLGGCNSFQRIGKNWSNSQITQTCNYLVFARGDFVTTWHLAWVVMSTNVTKPKLSFQVIWL